MNNPDFSEVKSLIYAVFFVFCTLMVSPVTAQTEATGSITVAGETLNFNVDLCNMTSISSVSNFILGGTAQTADGRMAVIQVNISEKPGISEHAVVVIKMDGQLYAHVAKVEGGTWQNDKGEPAEPMVTLVGKTVTAHGQFTKSTNPPEDIGEGTLEAHCTTIISTESS